MERSWEEQGAYYYNHTQAVCTALRFYHRQTHLRNCFAPRGINSAVFVQMGGRGLVAWGGAEGVWGVGENGVTAEWCLVNSIHHLLMWLEPL